MRKNMQMDASGYRKTGRPKRRCRLCYTQRHEVDRSIHAERRSTIGQRTWRMTTWCADPKQGERQKEEIIDTDSSPLKCTYRAYISRRGGVSSRLKTVFNLKHLLRWQFLNIVIMTTCQKRRQTYSQRWQMKENPATHRQAFIKMVA